MTHTLRTLGRRARGASLVEYGITVGLVSVLAIGSVLALGGEVRSTFVTVEETLASSLASAVGSPETADGTTAPGPASVADFTFSAGSRVGYGGSLWIGVVSNGYGARFVIGGVTQSGGPTVAHLTTASDPYDYTELIMGEDTTAIIDQSAVLRCSGQPDLSFSDTMWWPSFNGEIVAYRWDGVLYSLTPGQSYDCSIIPGS